MTYSDIRNTNAQRVRNVTVAGGVGPIQRRLLGLPTFL